MPTLSGLNTSYQIINQGNADTTAWGCGWNIMAGMGRRIIPDIRVILCNRGVEIDGDVD